MPTTSRKTVTLRDVAALAGIGKATASRALSGKGHISPQARQATLKAALELGFQPDVHAQRLAHGRNHNIITLLSGTDLGVLTQQVFSIEHSLNDSGFEVQAHKVPHYAPHFEKRQVALVNKVRRQRPGAIISGFPLLPQTLQELESFIQEGGAVIGYGDRMKLECDQVIFDSMHRAYLAARHLLELGHREIGFCFHSAVPQGGEDFDGFSRAMAEFDAPIRKEWIFGGGNYEEGGARLAEAFINWPEKPTGLCIINDVSASTFITTLYKNGLSVPDDVSVVGFDDAPAARYALVPLTSVSYPLTAISHHVVEFTRSRLEGYHGAPRTVVVPSELVSRSSTAPYRTQSHLISNASFLAQSLPSGRLLPVS